MSADGQRGGNRPIRVLVADDHPPTRAGVRAALGDSAFVVVAEASDAGSAVAAAHAERPDLCLLDVHMPGSGISAVRRISRECPETAVVMLTVSRSDDDLFDALRAGASGYLLKDIDPVRLPRALEGVLAGEAALPRALVARLIDEFRERGRYRRVPILRERGPVLTSREWEVLELLREGLTTKQIAERLFVSHATVRSHIAAILRKLRVPNREAAIRLLEEQAT
ncbi:MAG TPA: response regulator transcription factor [Gaiellaceae bacterium]|nr:response regulator transcription factor [Gaiellaceae bacterium]